MLNVSRLSLLSITHAVGAHWRAALAAAVLIMAALTAYITSLTPTYSAEALVLLAPEQEALGGRQDDAALAQTDPFFVRSETDVITSDQLALDVIRRLDLAKTPDFQSRPRLFGGEPHGPLTTSRLVAIYKNKLAVSNDGRSKTVRIGFAALSPSLAAKVANAHADAYLRAQSGRRAGTQQEALQWLSNEVRQSAAAMRSADASVQNYKVSNGIVGNGDSTVVDQRLSEVTTQLADARRTASTQASVLAEIRRLRAGGDVQGVDSLARNDVLTDLLRRRAGAEANLTALERRLAPGHPTLSRAREELAGVNQVLDGQFRRAEQAALSSARVAERQLADTSGALGAATARKTGQDRASAGLPGLEAQAAVAREVHQSVLNRYRTLMAETGFSSPSASVISRALAPTEPSFPRTGLFLAAALIAAAVGGAGLAVLIDLARPASPELAVLASVAGVRPIAAIPNRNKVAASEFLESIRTLRATIVEKPTGVAAFSCLLTSTLPGQGKSLTAIVLAQSIARTGLRTVFVDLDLRRPTATRLADVVQGPFGIGALLDGRAATVEQAVVHDAETGLDLLLVEPDAESALDRLSHAGIAQLLARLGERYRAIIIDSPPIGLSEALMLAPLVSKTILVARDGEVSAADLERAARLLREQGANDVGLVLTGVDPGNLNPADRKTLNHYLRLSEA